MNSKSEKIHCIADGGFVVVCSACKCGHYLDSSYQQDWNGSLKSPTFSRSVLAKGCHFFIDDGCIRYCADCTHEMAGRTVELDTIA